MCSGIYLCFFKITKTKLTETILGNVSVIFDVNIVDYIILAGRDWKIDDKTKNEE